MFNIKAFAPLMQNTVTIAPFTSYDGYGNASFGSAKTFQAAVVGKMERVTGLDGQEMPSRQTVYLNPLATVRPEDKITLSTGDVGSTQSYAINPEIISVGTFPFGRSQGCTVIDLK